MLRARTRAHGAFSRFGLVRLALFVGGVALLLTACGGGTEDGDDVAAQSSQDERDAPADTTEDSSADAPAEPRTLIVALEQVASQLDPAINEQDPTRRLHYELGSKLVQWDVSELDENGCGQLATLDDFQGELAESWEVNEDGTVVTFTLKEAVSAAGNTLTSEDVRWTFERNLAVEAHTNFMHYTVGGFAENPIHVIDDRTFEVHIATPTAFSIAAFQPGANGIFDSQLVLEHATEDDPWAQEWLANNTANFGPWQVTEDNFEPGTEIIFEANPNYVGERGNVDRMIFVAVAESSTRTQLLQTGEVDYAWKLSFTERESLEGSADIVSQRCQAASRDLLILNHAEAPFDDVLVRRAVSLAIDRDEIAEAAYRGFARPAIAGVNQFYEFSPTPEGTYEHDPEAARALLEEAGYPDGFEMELMFTPARPGPEGEQVAVLMQQQLAEVGIDVTLNLVAQNADFLERHENGRFQALYGQENSALPQAGYSGGIFNASWSRENYHGYASDVYDSVVDQLRAFDPAPESERVALLEELSEVVVQEVPALYIVDRVFPHAYASAITERVAPADGEMYAHLMVME